MSSHGLSAKNIMTNLEANEKLLSVPEFSSVTDATVSLCLSCMSPHSAGCRHPFPEPERSV